MGSRLRQFVLATVAAGGFAAWSSAADAGRVNQTLLQQKRSRTPPNIYRFDRYGLIKNRDKDLQRQLKELVTGIEKHPSVVTTVRKLAAEHFGKKADITDIQVGHGKDNILVIGQKAGQTFAMVVPIEFIQYIGDIGDHEVLSVKLDKKNVTATTKKNNR